MCKLSDIQNFWVSASLFCLAVFSLQSCHSSSSVEPTPVQTADHTLLIYIVGDNSLSSYAPTNISAASRGLLDAGKPMNVVIYKDNEEGHPVLFHLKVASDGLSVSRDTLFVWDEEVNSALPDQVAWVVDFVFNRTFTSTVKGLEMWSHGDSWVPGNLSYQLNSASGAGIKPLTYIGIDGTSYLETDDLASALASTGVHFDYMFFDACHMATAEVAYELRNVTDYIAGSSNEIMGAGLPYNTFVPSLAECQSTSEVESALRALVTDFENVYGENGTYKNNGGTFSVIRTSAMPSLLEGYKNLRLAHPEALQALQENAETLRFTIQRYGRRMGSTSDRTGLYHDMGALLRYIGGEDNAVLSLLREAVVSEFHSSFFKVGTSSDNMIEFTDVSGMAVTVPEFLGLYNNSSAFTTAYYGKCAWGMDLK